MQCRSNASRCESPPPLIIYFVCRSSVLFSYCPNPQTRIECPSGYFCKEGSIAPKKCQGLASCPAGSAAALIFWQGIILIVVIFAGMAGVYYAVIYYQFRRRRREQQLAEQRSEEEQVVELLQSLRSFQHLDAHAGGGAKTIRLPRRATSPHGGQSGKPSLENEFVLTRTSNDDFAVVRRFSAADAGWNPDKDPKAEVVGILTNRNKQRRMEEEGEDDKADSDTSGKHEQMTVIMPRGDEQGEMAMQTLPLSARLKTDADMPPMPPQQRQQHATDAQRPPPPHISPLTIPGSDDEDSSDEEDERDSISGFDPIPCPTSLTFDQLGLKLRNGTEILKGVSGHIKAGQLTAVMGPSGCGKSTFLNVLCGKATYGRMTGSIRVNGVETPISRLKSVMGFVPQEDVMHSDLTVYENLYYSAMLRLPRSMPHDQKKRIVDETIRMLGLDAIRHSVVGNVEKRGISGGQRKRVNIGMEIVSWPTLLFMDEPSRMTRQQALRSTLRANCSRTRVSHSVLSLCFWPACCR